MDYPKRLAEALGKDKWSIEDLLTRFERCPDETWDGNQEQTAALLGPPLAPLQKLKLSC